jgi:hypothetical protein
MTYPVEIERFHAALTAVPGVHEVHSGIRSLEGLSEALLELPDCASMPIGALRRTHGGLESEALAQIEFRIVPDEAGWRSIEFLAWFFRDQARGGVAVQMRPFALPPATAHGIQLGRTLRWQIDLFFLEVGNDLSPQLKAIEQMAGDLELARQAYADALVPSS